MLIIKAEYVNGKNEEYNWNDIKNFSGFDGDIITGRWLTDISATYNLYSFKLNGIPLWHYVIMSTFYSNIRNLILDIEVYLEFLNKKNDIKFLTFIGPIPKGIMLVNQYLGLSYQHNNTQKTSKHKIIKRIKRVVFLAKAGTLYLKRAFRTYCKLRKEGLSYVDLLIESPSVTYRSTDDCGIMQDSLFTNSLLEKIHSSNINYCYIEFMNEINSAKLSLENHRDILYEEYFRIKHLICKVLKFQFVKHEKKETKYVIESIKSTIKGIYYKDINLTEAFFGYIDNANIKTDKDFYQYLIGHFNPKLTMSFCATNLYTSTISFCQHERGLRSIEYQHGNIHQSLSNYLPDLYDHHDLKPLPDYYFVWGKYYKDLNSTELEATFGYPNNYISRNIRVVGNTKMYEFLQTYHSPKSEILSTMLGITAVKKKKVLILLSDEVEKEFILDLMTKMQLDKRYDKLNSIFIIKPHPGMRMEQASFDSDKVIIMKKNDHVELFDLLKSIDICVCMSTTVAFEALALRVPLVILKSAYSYVLEPILVGQDVYRCESMEDFIRLLQNIDNDSQAENLKPDHYQADYFINTKLNPHSEIVYNITRILNEINDNVIR